MIVITLVAALGVIIGMLSGLLTSLILRLGRKGFWKDALLGGIGTFIGLFAAYTVPWPEYTITSPSGMQETMSRFPYPFLVAYVVAAMLPIIRQTHRYKLSRLSRS
jgi:fructose-specific phosphotransferase system IIC component